MCSCSANSVPIREKITVQQRRKSIDLVHDVIDRAALARLRVRGAEEFVLGRNHLGARIARAHCERGNDASGHTHGARERERESKSTENTRSTTSTSQCRADVPEHQSVSSAIKSVRILAPYPIRAPRRSYSAPREIACVSQTTVHESGALVSEMFAKTCSMHAKPIEDTERKLKSRP